MEPITTISLLVAGASFAKAIKLFKDIRHLQDTYEERYARQRAIWAVEDAKMEMELEVELTISQMKFEAGRAIRDTKFRMELAALQAKLEAPRAKRKSDLERMLEELAPEFLDEYGFEYD